MVLSLPVFKWSDDLTPIVQNKIGDWPVYIDAGDVRAVHREKDGTLTRVWVADKLHPIQVIETPEEVVRLMKTEGKGL